ncbi:methyltransferase domain-containing protein [Shewanella sp. JM162201]|uniref:Methyltransferase domain-containing protein n=1 Tax=Shewanella jiangmenensis TaxID=2837387 RepID=A0ABS5V1D0_9GAMM|nr:methyltransferase domain-containing protein [Shewanella jiangmenensis]MBT1444269.1 methyltransferase domain-containing protein [Shewanella jiangmenensis]
MSAPSPLFAAFEGSFNRPGLRVLDLACGSGRNGLWFLEQGHQVSFIDRDLSALAPQIVTHPNASCLQMDLEISPSPALGEFDVVLVFNYLHRPLFATLQASVVAGGLMVYETFTHEQAKLGRPRNPNFLLNDGELKQRFTGWQLLYYGEDSPETRPDSPAYKARIICRKPLEN